MDTRYCALASLLLMICCALLIIPAVAISTPSELSGNDALTRGSRFTITITGIPNTPYYVWLARTWSLSGKPGDQPPLIVGSQWNVEKDPDGGPYTIGSYAYNNGNGRTILDDVAPSTASQSATSYYALVTTDSSGTAIVEFRTSANTAIRTFSVRVENPTSANTDTLLVQRGDQNVKQGAVSIEAVTTQTPPRTTPPTPPPTPAPLPSLEITSLPQTTVPPTEMPTQKMPLEMVWCIIAVGVGLLMVRNR